MTNEQLAILLNSIACQINLRLADIDQDLMRAGIEPGRCVQYALNMRGIADSLFSQARQLGVSV